VLAPFELALPEGSHQPGTGQRRLATAGGADDGQEPGRVGLARRGPQPVEQPVGQRLAAAEERGVLHVEALQAAVRTLALVERLAGAWAGLDAADAAQQPVEGVLLV